MDFLECWTSWLEGVFNSIKGLQVLPVPCSSLSRPPYLLQSKALQIFLFTDFGEKSGWITHPRASNSYTRSGFLGMEVTGLAYKSESQIL